MMGMASGASEVSPTLGGQVNSAGKKIVAKVVAVIAVSGSVFTLCATSATASPISAVALAKLQASLPACRPPSRAHCYTEETMQSYIHDAAPLVLKFFREKYKAMPEQWFPYRFIAEGTEVQSRGCGNFNENSYAYCSSDHTVYLGQARMWELYNEDGDIAPAVALAHEWGHNIQSRKGIKPPKPGNNAESVNNENQADRIAGAFVQYTDQQHQLEPEDGYSIEKMLSDIASAEGTDRQHGTLKERRKAMLWGRNYGLSGCNKYYPEHPIITSRD